MLPSKANKYGLMWLPSTLLSFSDFFRHDPERFAKFFLYSVQKLLNIVFQVRDTQAGEIGVRTIFNIQNRWQISSQETDLSDKDFGLLALVIPRNPRERIELTAWRSSVPATFSASMSWRTSWESWFLVSILTPPEAVKADSVREIKSHESSK
jgi:hypothetical protein